MPLKFFAPIGRSCPGAAQRPGPGRFRAALPPLLGEAGVVALGETGFERFTEEEERAFRFQLEAARGAGLPVIVHTPQDGKKRAVLRSLAIIRESGLDEGRALIEHNSEETLPLVLDTGCWAGHSIPARRALSLLREHGSARILLGGMAEAAAYFQEAGLPPDQVRQLAWDNPVAFFSQSGRLDLSEAA